LNYKGKSGFKLAKENNLASTLNRAIGGYYEGNPKRLIDEMNTRLNENEIKLKKKKETI